MMDAASASTAPAPHFAQMLEFGTGRLALGGHRGMGANVWDASGPAAATTRSRRYRENTVASFLAAASAGATFLEFDVQVTADNVPVIFHDNFLVYGDHSSPTSSLVRSLSVADFKAKAPIKSSSSDLSGLSDDESGSAGASPRGIAGGASPRLLRKHRNGEAALPYEPSLHPWEVAQEDNFPTLAEVFMAVPTHVAFDIEIKMSTPASLARTPEVEVNRIVRATLAAVDAAFSGNSTHRDLMFSSFDPDVCVAMKNQRPEFPVMFLSGGEAETHVDERRTTLMSAVEFAAVSGLDGVIFDTEVVKTRPGAVAAARSRGLHVMTYGLGNDQEEWLMEQESIGVHGAIVDDVERAVRAFAV